MKGRLQRLEERFEELTARVQALKNVEGRVTRADEKLRLRRKHTDAMVALEQCAIELDRARSRGVL